MRHIKDGVPYALYEFTPQGEERYLEPDEVVLDLVAYWQRLFEEEKDKSDEARRMKKAVAGLSFFRLVFKVHLYFDPPAGDAAAQRATYVQAVWDVVSARYPATDADLRALAAMQMQAEAGDAGVPDLAEHLAHFLPVKTLPRAGSPAEAELLADLVRRHRTHAAKSRAQAADDYLRAVRAWPVYGSSFFLVEPQMSADLPADVFLAVNPRGVLIINAESRAVIVSHPYDNLPMWGHSGNSFVLHVAAPGAAAKDTKKLYFNTTDGKEIDDLIRSYVNWLAAQPAPSS